MKIRIAVLLLFAAQANAAVLYGTLGNGWLAEYDPLTDAYSYISQKTSFTSIAFDPFSGAMYGTLGNGWLAEYDPLTDAYSHISQKTSFTSIAFQSTPAQVPEPGTAMLLLLGIVGLGISRIYRQLGYVPNLKFF